MAWEIPHPLHRINHAYAPCEHSRGAPSVVICYAESETIDIQQAIRREEVSFKMLLKLTSTIVICAAFALGAQDKQSILFHGGRKRYENENLSIDVI